MPRWKLRPAVVASGECRATGLVEAYRPEYQRNAYLRSNTSLFAHRGVHASIGRPNIGSRGLGRSRRRTPHHYRHAASRFTRGLVARARLTQGPLVEPKIHGDALSDGMRRATKVETRTTGDRRSAVERVGRIDVCSRGLGDGVRICSSLRAVTLCHARSSSSAWLVPAVAPDRADQAEAARRWTGKRA